MMNYKLAAASCFQDISMTQKQKEGRKQGKHSTLGVLLSIVTYLVTKEF